LSDVEPTEDLEDLYENAPCGYLSLRPDGRIVKVNGTLCTWLALPVSGIVGKRLRDLLTVPGAIFYETHFSPLLRMQGFFHEVALDLVKANGSQLPVLASAAERRDEAGDVMFTRLTILRAVDRRRYERELQDNVKSLTAGIAEREEGRLQAQHAAELREQFIAVLGHDLRNPLAGLEGGRRILESIHSDPKSVRVLRLMAESVSRMSKLIDNVMDFARGRLGGGIGIVRSAGERIEPTLSQVVNEIRAAHPDRQIEIRFNLSGAIDVDHARIAQMFSNLVGNAVAHGAADTPVVIEATDADGMFELSVANTGDPIPAAALERLFQPFYRGEVRPNSQGLGLGLYIASQIAKAHGGTLEAESDLGGTRFSFRMTLHS
jgi:sigma-B regulation protein RsbU (phosphoserine phosphatase)